jgi:hypothetical protein
MTGKGGTTHLYFSVVLTIIRYQESVGPSDMAFKTVWREREAREWMVDRLST